ncbi:MAG: hypothetical protein OEZ36_04595, partial [Spirochaetota bacterium]|nr:hypothetical protein [Spirochaetota bacterium]
YTLTFYYSNDKKSYKVKPVTHEVNRSFNPGEAISLGSSSFSHEKSVNYDKVGVIINKSFNLEKALHKK